MRGGYTSLVRPWSSLSRWRTGTRFDVDAQSYFDAVELAGGSFDLTSINATYTEAYVKQAHSDFYAGVKTDGLWDKLTEFYFLAGKTFAGLTVKGKGTGTLTNNNFVTGDFLPVGTGAGLTGDGSTKYLDTGLLDSSLSADDKSISIYATANSAARGVAIGQFASDGVMLYSSNLASQAHLYLPYSTANINEAFNQTTGHHIGSRRGVNDVESYTNGVSTKTDTSTAAASSNSLTYYIFRNNRGAAEYSSPTLTFAHIGTGLTDTEAANLSTRVNTLMTALGCNVY